MPNIFYYTNASGTRVAKWPGKGRSVNGVSRKEGQLYLGRVVNMAEHVFYKRGLGYYRFDTVTQECLPIAEDEVPPYDGPVDGREREAPVCVVFGSVYLLDQLIRGIEYAEVLESITFANRDTLMTMVQYYTLEDRADRHAELWYKSSYASFLYPRANVASQRVSDMLRAIGSDNARRAFLEAHIKYLVEGTDEPCYVLVDSTDCPNACGVPITRVSNHDGKVSICFRLIAVVQRSTGLPIWYEIIPGNVVDVSTIENVVRKLRLYGCRVECVLGDAGYYCPANAERLALSGIDFVARMNPTYDTYKRVLEEHHAELDDTANVVRHEGRPVSVVKVGCTVATDAETGREVPGWVYLCRDEQSHHSKCDRLLSNEKKTRKMTAEELCAACERLGVFAIVSTRELSTDELLPEYYLRQKAEQLFDFAKGVAKMLPIRNRTMETISGHILLSFVATFLHVVVKNRMGIVDTHYVAPPRALLGRLAEADGEPFAAALPDGGTQAVLEQDPVAEALRRPTDTVFYSTGLWSAEVFDREIVPAPPTKEARETIEAFGLHKPVAIVREGLTLTPLLKAGERDRCTRARAFASRPAITDEQIEAQRARAEEKKIAEARALVAANPEPDDAAAQPPSPPNGGPKPDATVAPPQADTPKPARRRGRPKGSKNKKTLAREAEEARLAELGLLPPKRGRGRPKGSKNKKTLAREAAGDTDVT